MQGAPIPSFEDVYAELAKATDVRVAAKQFARYLKFPPLAKDTDEFDYGEVLFTKYKKSIRLKHLKTCFQDLRSVLWVLAAQRGIRLLSSGEEPTTDSDTYVCHGAQLNGIFSKIHSRNRQKKKHDLSTRKHLLAAGLGCSSLQQRQ